MPKDIVMDWDTFCDIPPDEVINLINAKGWYGIGFADTDNPQLGWKVIR